MKKCPRTPDFPDIPRVYARREDSFRPSAVRAVFETAMRPEVISLAGGNPDLSFLNHEFISEIAGRGLVEDGENILQYGSGAGTDGVRELSAALMAWGGAEYRVPEIQMTSGSQAGLDAVTKVLCDPGDVIIAEAPTYVGVLGTFGAYEVEVRQVPLDSGGLDPDRVAQTIDELQAAGKVVRFVYTISAHQNPAGISLAVDRHERLVEVCASRGVWVVEDDAYGLLDFPTRVGVSESGAPRGAEGLAGGELTSSAGRRLDSGEAAAGDRSVKPVALPGGAEWISRAPMLARVSPEHVIHLGSYSKIFSPGARVGWIGAPQHLRERLQIACESVCITPSVLAQTLVEKYVGTPQWRTGLVRQKLAYAQRCAVAIEAAEECLPAGTTWLKPRGGFFLWSKLPQRERPWGDVLELAVAQKVVIIPGSGCYVGPEPGTHVRVAFSAVDEAQIRRGFQRLAAALA